MLDKELVIHLSKCGLAPYLSIFRKKKVHEKIRIWLPKKEFKKYFGDYENKKYMGNIIFEMKPHEWIGKHYLFKVAGEIQKDVYEEANSYLYIIDAIVDSVNEKRLDKINETDLVLLDIPRFSHTTFTLKNFNSFIKDNYTYCKGDEDGFIIVFSKNKSQVEDYFKALKKYKLILAW